MSATRTEAPLGATHTTLTGASAMGTQDTLVKMQRRRGPGLGFESLR